MNDKLPLLFEPQPEGGFTVTSPLLPELVTEGDTVVYATENDRDAERSLPPNLRIADPIGR